MRKAYDPDGDDSTYDGTDGGRPVVYAGVAWTPPTLVTEAGHIGYEIALHTGSNPETAANRVAAITRVSDPSAVDSAIKLPSKKSGTATVNASVRMVFTFGRGPWVTSGTPDTQTTGTVVVPGINTVNAVGSSPNANAATIAVDNKSITLQPADSSNPGVVIPGAQNFGTGTKSFGGDVSVAGDLTVVGNISAANFGGGSGGSPDIILYGGGEDGNLSSGFGTITLTRDTYYNNITFSATDKIICDGWRCFASGTVDMAAAGADAIAQKGADGSNGTGTTGGAAATDNTFGGAVRSLGCAASAQGAQAGASGNSAGLAGGTAVGGSMSGNFNGGVTYSGGQGGTGGAQAGGTVIAPSGTPTRNIVDRWTVDISIAFQISNGANNTVGFYAGAGGMGGSGGGSSANTRASGAGGGGGGGGQTMWLAFKTIARGTNTTAGIISLKGGKGGNGSNAVGTNCGGGGGGAGGGAGWGFLTYKTLTGSSISNAIDLSGGGGGNGGNGTGTGTGGNGGDSGQSGLFYVFDTTNMTITRTGWVNGVTGTAHTGATGGAGATNVQRISL